MAPDEHRCTGVRVSTDTALQLDDALLAQLEPSIPCGMRWDDNEACPAEADFAVHVICELCGERWAFIRGPCLDLLEATLGTLTTCRGNPICSSTSPSSSTS